MVMHLLEKATLVLSAQKLNLPEFQGGISLEGLQFVQPLFTLHIWITLALLTEFVNLVVLLDRIENWCTLEILFNCHLPMRYAGTVV